MAAEMMSLLLPLHRLILSLTSPEKGVNGASHRNDITPQPFPQTRNKKTKKPSVKTGPS